MLRNFTIIIIILFSISLHSQVAITIPSEYEKNEKLLVTWPYNSDIDTVIAEIVGISNDYTKVDIIYNPDNTSFDTTAIRMFLISLNADNSNTSFIPAYNNTSKLRQYSPVIGYGVFIDTLVRYIGNPGFDHYYRPADDSIPSQLANYWNMDMADYGLQYENTNLQYDGLRNLFVGDRILEENIPMSETDIKFSLNAYYNSGVVTILPTPMYSGGGSLVGLENYIKMIDFETILLTSIPDTLPDYILLEEISGQLSAAITNFGKSYEIIRIPASPNDNGKFTTTSDGEFRSYTNSLILNNLIIIPSFGLADYDSAALEIYENHMPGYDIRFVDATTLSEVHSGIHTVTKEVPQPNFLRILHSKMIGVQEFYPEVKINTLCGTATQLENMWLYYKKNSDTAYTKEEIHLVCPQYFAVIDKLTPEDTVHYYIEAISSSAHTTYPLSAPEGNFTFWFDVVSNNEDLKSANSYNIIPNPSSGRFSISSTENISDDVDISIFNGKGQLIYDGTHKVNTIIDIQNKVSSGFYTLIIHRKGSISTDKLIITE